MTNKTLKAITLSTELANTLNNINHNTFTQTELQESIQEYTFMLLHNDTTQIIETLESEISNGNMEVLPLYKSVLTF